MREVLFFLFPSLCRCMIQLCLLGSTGEGPGQAAPPSIQNRGDAIEVMV